MFSITKNGKPLDKSLYTRDEKTKTLSTNENYLVLDFSDYSYCTFNTGPNCTFNTGSNCNFYTGSNCTFNTGSNCNFYTGSNCTFNTGSNCNFYTGSDCTFDTGPNCTFNTWYNCNFNTGSNCTFDTGSRCTFNTGPDCVVVRRDVFEVIILKEEENHIKLNGYNIPGYTNILEEEIEELTVEMEAKVIIDVDELSDICYDISMAVMNTDGEEENIRNAIQTELEKYVYKRKPSQD